LNSVTTYCQNWLLADEVKKISLCSASLAYSNKYITRAVSTVGSTNHYHHQNRKLSSSSIIELHHVAAG